MPADDSVVAGRSLKYSLPAAERAFTDWRRNGHLPFERQLDALVMDLRAVPHASGDLVVTADIPLAAAVLERGAHALNPRGEMYTAANIAERLSMRNFLEELRSSGVQTGGPAAFSHADRQAFGATLDRFLARHTRA